MPSFEIEVPDLLARAICTEFGETGAVWLRQLPELIEQYAQRWSMVDLGPPFSGGWINFVVPVTLADGSEAVLKVGVPHPESFGELAALRLYEGRGVVRLLDSDPDQATKLLERVSPGTTLADSFELSEDDRATRIAGEAMRRLWRPAPAGHSFPTVAEWARGLEKLRPHYGGGTGPFPAALVERAEGLFAELSASSDVAVLLHGDLHHYNILAAEREPWLVIDPQGVVGDPGFEVGPFLWNPEGIKTAPDAGRLIRRRLDILSEVLEIDRARLHGWSLAFSVLSAWWCVEGHTDGWKDGLRFSEILVEQC